MASTPEERGSEERDPEERDSEERDPEERDSEERDPEERDSEERDPEERDSEERDWRKQAAAAERAFAASDRAAHRLETVGGRRYLEQVERIRQQVEGPAKQYVEMVEQARKATEGPAKQYFEMLENVRQTVQGPARAAAEMVEQARKATEGPAKQYFEMLENVRQTVQGPARAAAEMVEQARMTLEGPARRMREHYVSIGRLLDQYDFRAVVEAAAAAGAQIQQQFKQSLPVNWRSLSVADVEKVERLVREEGVPLLWVPNGELTARLVSKTTGPEVMKVLLAERDTVLADVEHILDEVTDVDLEALVRRARKAVAALADGHGDAAQALAAAVFTAALQEGLGHKDLQDVRKEANKRSPAQATLATYRGTLVVHLAARYVQGRGYELPGFNRSTTLHRIEDAQYTPANNLAAVMAAAGVLREAQARRSATASSSV